MARKKQTTTLMDNDLKPHIHICYLLDISFNKEKSDFIQ
jgi:hypothetical protein